MIRRRLRARAGVPGIMLAVTVLALTGCTDPAALTPAAPSATAPSPTPQLVMPTVIPTGDGVVRIGTIFPMTGAAAASGAAQVAGAQLAAREVFGQGGVPGHTVELIHRGTGGDLAASIADLLARGVDVVLWDATTTPSDDVVASVTGAGPAFLALGEFANGGTPLDTDADLAARVRTADPTLSRTAGAAEAYDGVIVTALAALAVNDDAAVSVEIGWAFVSQGQRECASFHECTLALTDAQSIAYVGVTGRRS